MSQITSFNKFLTLNRCVTATYKYVLMQLLNKCVTSICFNCLKSLFVVCWVVSCKYIPFLFPFALILSDIHTSSMFSVVLWNNTHYLLFWCILVLSLSFSFFPFYRPCTVLSNSLRLVSIFAQGQNESYLI